MAVTERDLEQVVSELAARHGVPGASVAVLRDGDVLRAAAGLANADAGIEMTPDTVFLIGSITKVWTTTLVMTLVREGSVELDARVRDYLPGLRLLDESAADAITVRHLLTHTSGLTGDVFVDHGRGDDAVARYVDGLAATGQLHAPGELASYCNSGFVIAGRVVEAVTGVTYHRALRERVIEPLGLSRTVTLPEEAMLHRVSVSHYRAAGGAARTLPLWAYPYSMSPAGSTLAASADDLAAFGRMHLHTDETGILDAADAAGMRTPQTGLPYPDYADLGLGWFLFHGYGTPVAGHAGGSPAGLDTLLVFPALDAVVVWYANIDPSGAAPAFGRDLESYVVPEMLGATVPPRALPPHDPPDDLTAYEGTYRHGPGHVVARSVDGELELTGRSRSSLAPYAEYDVGPLRLRPVDGTMFWMQAPGATPQTGRKYLFIERDSSGRPAYFHTGMRAWRRDDDTEATR